VIKAVTWRAARAGMVTGVLLAIARISGETAPLLLTVLSNQFPSYDMSHPVASLPVIIYNYAMNAYEDWHKLAWAGALIITAAVLTLSIIARILESSRKS
jgi:phosphate transport system permease protein